MPNYHNAGKSVNRTVNHQGTNRPGKGLTGMTSPPRSARMPEIHGTATNTLKTGIDKSEVSPGSTAQSRNKNFST